MATTYALAIDALFNVASTVRSINLSFWGARIDRGGGGPVCATVLMRWVEPQTAKHAL